MLIKFRLYKIGSQKGDHANLTARLEMKEKQ